MLGEAGGLGVTTVFLAGVLAGYGVAIPVGAIAVLIVGLTARTSPRVGVAAAFGVATADGLYALVAVIGGAALATMIEPVAAPMRWVAAAVLFLIAAHTAVGAVRHHRDPARAARSRSGLSTPARAFPGLLALTLLNPMTVVYFAALVLGRQASDGLTDAGPLTLVAPVFVVGVFVASASWQLLIAAGGVLVGKSLTGQRGRLLTSLASSALIVALALAQLTS